MNNLTDRIYRYLQRRGSAVWVTKPEIVALCHDNGYKTPYVMKSIEELLTYPNIGYVYKDGVARYCWYYMTDEELELHKLQLQFFDDLP